MEQYFLRDRSFEIQCFYQFNKHNNYVFAVCLTVLFRGCMIILCRSVQDKQVSLLYCGGFKVNNSVLQCCSVAVLLMVRVRLHQVWQRFILQHVLIPTVNIPTLCDKSSVCYMLGMRMLWIFS